MKVIYKKPLPFIIKLRCSNVHDSPHYKTIINKRGEIYILYMYLLPASNDTIIIW